MHSSQQVIAGKSAGNFRNRIRKIMNPLKLLFGFGSCLEHQNHDAQRHCRLCDPLDTVTDPPSRADPLRSIRYNLTSG